jgi:small subunit ribosomal protein S5
MARAREEWIPKTKLGRMVLKGEISTMSEALATGLPLREPEIVDILLPDLEDEVLDVNMVQRMTDSGRRVNFSITCVVGNRDGFVGLGRTRGREVGPSIRKAIDIAKLNILALRRGCGSWECGCYTTHSLPFKVRGKSGSVEVTLKPAPRGVGLAVGDVSKSILSLAGLQDVWGFARGHTKTTVNFALATFAALKRATTVKIRPEVLERLKIRVGAEQEFVHAVKVEEPPPVEAAAPTEGEATPAEDEAAASEGTEEAPVQEGGEDA